MYPDVPYFCYQIILLLKKKVFNVNGLKKNVCSLLLVLLCLSLLVPVSGSGKTSLQKCAGDACVVPPKSECIGECSNIWW